MAGPTVAILLLVVVDSLFIISHIVRVLCLILVLLCNTLCPFCFFNHFDGKKRPGLEVIKLEFILRLKIKHNGWLLADTCPKQPIIALYFESETVSLLYLSLIDVM